jgi:hypothetical protein
MRVFQSRVSGSELGAEARRLHVVRDDSLGIEVETPARLE